MKMTPRNFNAALLALIFFLLANIGMAQTKVKVSVQNNMLTITNTANNKIIISPNNQPLWDNFGEAEHYRKPYVGVPAITTQTVSNGCNITFKFTNNTLDTVSLGKIQIGGIRFDSLIKARAFDKYGEEETYNHHNDLSKSFTAYGKLYPRNLFSPVMTINDGKHTICLSMLYPVLEYKHNVYQYLMSYFNKSYQLGGKNWSSVFKLNACTRKDSIYETDPTKYSAGGDLSPGETRSYTLCIRILTNTNKCETWLGGLQPYKDYFRSLYGVAHYPLDRRPIKGYSLADTPTDETGPYGFSQPTMRPDLYGFGPISDWIIDKSDNTNYERVMIWQPTGLYKNNDSLNFPFKSFSHWQEGDPTKYKSYGHKMGDAVDSLKKIATPNRKLGFWWGRVGHLMTKWDTNYYERLNPYNNTHVNIAYKELDLAVKAGATMVGLDNFGTQIPYWDGYVWMKKMRLRAPGVKFYPEKWCPDFILTQSAMLGKDDGIVGPFYMADFLVPGNEKQALMWTSYTKEDRAIRRKELNDWGYCVTTFDRDTLTVPGLADFGWHENNPYPDLGPDKCVNPKGITLNGKCKGALSYQWSTGATTSTISVKYPGTYWVKTMTANCTVYDTVIIGNCKQTEIDYWNFVSDDENSSQESNNQTILQSKNTEDFVNIYPNPSRESVTIANVSENNIMSIKLYDMLGNLVTGIHNNLLAYETITIPVTGYSEGMYFLIIDSENGSFSKKLIITR